MSVAMPEGFGRRSRRRSSPRSSAWSARSPSTPLTIAGALLVLLAGLGGVGWFAWTRGRDRRWRGQVPGLEPGAGQPEDDSATERRPLFTGPEGAVEFALPDGVRPGQVGTLLDEQANPLDVTAIDRRPRRARLPAHRGAAARRNFLSRRDWKLTQLKQADDALLPYESTLLDALFDGRSEVLVSELKRTFATDLRQGREPAVRRRRAAGLVPAPTRHDPAAVGSSLGIACVGRGRGADVPAGAVHARRAHRDRARSSPGSRCVVVSPRMPARTAKGSAELARILGFRQYIATAEAEPAEVRGAGRHLLPLPAVRRRVRRDRPVGARVRRARSAPAGSPAAAALGWYVGPYGWSFANFGDSMRSFSDTTVGAIAATAASSGGSGFGGGGFSGGGFGGGGGGSW